MAAKRLLGLAIHTLYTSHVYYIHLHRLMWQCVMWKNKSYLRICAGNDRSDSSTNYNCKECFYPNALNRYRDRIVNGRERKRWNSCVEIVIYNFSAFNYFCCDVHSLQLGLPCLCLMCAPNSNEKRLIYVLLVVRVLCSIHHYIQAEEVAYSRTSYSGLMVMHMNIIIIIM